MAKGIVEIIQCNQCRNLTVVDLKKLWCIKECPSCESRDIEIWNEKGEKGDEKD